MKNKLKNKKGFTLIELIVVIAVIGILALLAAPKFLGHTKDAHVSAMKTDAKVLSNAALVYNIDQETKGTEGSWPTKDPEKEVNIDGETYKGFGIDDSKLDSKYIKSLKGDIDEYILVVEANGDKKDEGEVYHIEGVQDKEGDVWFGVDLKGDRKLPH